MSPGSVFVLVSIVMWQFGHCMDMGSGPTWAPMGTGIGATPMGAGLKPGGGACPLIASW